MYSEKVRKELIIIVVVMFLDRGLLFDELLIVIFGFMLLVDDVEVRDEFLDFVEDMIWVLFIDEMELFGLIVFDLLILVDVFVFWVDLVERFLLDEGYIVFNEIDDGVDEVWMREGF